MMCVNMGLTCADSSGGVCRCVASGDDEWGVACCLPSRK